MHKSAMLRMKWFVDNYVSSDVPCKILDVGSYDVNGCYRTLFDGWKVDYVGLDMEFGPNVDYVPNDPYVWDELSDDSFDFIISANAFEHIEYPWLTIKEMYKKLKDGGIACILAPNNINEHRYPVDCYRYFSDGFSALARWGGFQVIDVTVSGLPDENVNEDWYSEGFNDTMMIIIKSNEPVNLSNYPKFKLEKRARMAKEWMLRYYFLLNWVHTENKVDIMTSFVKTHDLKRIYLYGYGDIGRIVYKELEKIEGIDIDVIDRTGGIVSGKRVLHPGEKITRKSASCILNCVYDPAMRDKLTELYPGMTIYYADDFIRN